MVAKRAKQKQVDDYRHVEPKRLNIPPAALAREDLDEVPTRKFGYDPHLPPELWWAGKDHSAALEVEAPSIHIHERLSAEAIVRAAQKQDAQLDLFGDPGLDRSKAAEFYEHEMDWANRLILGDSLVAMTSLLERERLGGQVQMIYIDPPYGINYASNFQPNMRSTNVKDRDADFTREPEQIQAYRDTWELGVHSYLSFLRERFTAARDLLTQDGSLFVQIGDERLHLVRMVLDEVFGPECFCSQISFRTKIPLRTTLVPNIYDHLLWYTRTAEAGKPRPKFRRIFQERDIGAGTQFSWVEESDGSRRRMTREELDAPDSIPEGSRVFRVTDLVSAGRTESCVFPFEFEGRSFPPPPSGKSWKTNREGIERLIEERRIFVPKSTPGFVFYYDDYPVQELPNVWNDTQGATDKVYAVQTATKVIERCMLMTTDPGDLVLDPTCGGGTTPYVAEKIGRRWIATDTSRVSIALSRERLLSASFDYYELKDEERGVQGGFVYKEVPHVTLGSITRREDPSGEPLYDRPRRDGSKVRVSGPFTVEGLSRYATDPFNADGGEGSGAAAAASHVAILLDALRSQGIPRQNGKPADVVSLTPIAGGEVLHAEGVFRDADGSEKSFGVSLGPRHGPITPLQVDEALAEAPGYELIVFAGFSATAEAQEYLAPGKRGRVRVALLEANPDLLLGDLLKQTKASQTFRLFSSPEVEMRGKGGELVVEVLGMDSFDAASGEVVSRDRGQIACWLLDTNYEGTVFRAHQVFFTANNAWDSLAKALRGTVDEEAIAQLHSFESLPFARPESGRVAVRVIDDAGSTSERVLATPES